jgi:hypothetical protein
MLAYKFRSPSQLNYALDIILEKRLHCSDWKQQVTTRLLLSASLVFVVAIGNGCAGVDDRRPATNATEAATLAVADPVDHLDVIAREPMVVEHPDGTLFVSGYGEPAPRLWKSRDRGATWARVNVGNETSGAIGNSDVDLAVAGDGTLYFVTMVFDRKAAEGVSVSIGVSKDIGATWSWTLLSKTRFDDRPWVEVSSDGTVHVIWNDGNGVCYAVSKDRGDTWTERPRIHEQGGSSHLATGPNGKVAVRVTPLSASGNKFDDGVDIVAVSTDAGMTWQKHAAPGQRDWSPLVDTKASPPRWVEPSQPRWVEPLAWDAQGAIYSLWANLEGLWLARSVNEGATWMTWRMVESADVIYYPYLIARGTGELAATWFSGRAETLQAHLARLEVSDVDATPRIIESQPFRTDSWGAGARPEDPPVRDSAGEYLAVAFLKDGGLGMVGPVQNRRANRFGFSWWTTGPR